MDPTYSTGNMESTMPQPLVDLARPPDASRPDIPDRLFWDFDEDTDAHTPTCSQEPDRDTVIRVALNHLPADCFADIDAPITRGSLHTLYELSSRGKTPPARYLMRVARPVEPFFKTESEVATMEYVRRHTSMPVPRVIAYDSNTSNAIGFEWILMEKIEGVAIDTAWSTMTPLDKACLTDEMGQFMKQLLSHRFSMIGNIYFAGIRNRVGYPPQPTSPSEGLDTNIGADNDFVIGRMFDRGPYATAHNWVMAEATLLTKRMLRPSLLSKHFCCEDPDLSLSGTEVTRLNERMLRSLLSPKHLFHEDYDPSLSDTEADAQKVLDNLRNAIPEIVASPDGPQDTKLLWHHDLGGANIIVDPHTFKINGVIDWGSVNITPAWNTHKGIPQFLRGISVREPPPLGSVPPEEEEYFTEFRKDWELVLLRRRFSEVRGPLHGKPSVDRYMFKHKGEFYREVLLFGVEGGGKRMDTWLKGRWGPLEDAIVQADSSDESDDGEDGSDEDSEDGSYEDSEDDGSEDDED